MLLTHLCCGRPQISRVYTVDFKCCYAVVTMAMRDQLMPDDELVAYPRKLDHRIQQQICYGGR